MPVNSLTNLSSAFFVAEILTDEGGGNYTFREAWDEGAGALVAKLGGRRGTAVNPGFDELTAGFTAGDYALCRQADGRGGLAWELYPFTSGAATSSLTRLFSYFADVSNSGAGETDLYTDSVVAGTLAADGDALEAHYSGIFVGTPTSPTVKLYFAGTSLLNFTGPNTSGSWWVDLSVMRTSNTTAIARANYFWRNAITTAWNGSVDAFSGLALGSTAYTLKITGQGSGSTQVTARMGYAEKKPA